MDSQKLDTFIQKVVGDLGAAFSIGPVRIGGALGIYGAMAELGGMSSQQLAVATGLSERYVREWLWHQAASGYVEYDAGSGQFTLPPEHAFVLADPQSPAHVLPGFTAAVALSDNMPAVMQAFRTGEGVAWNDQSGCIACAIGDFFRPGYRTNLIESWLPSLDGVIERLKAGAVVADVGCGHGHTTRLMAQAFPRSRFVGIDFHGPSIEAARLHASAHGKIDNLKFEIGSAQDFEGNGLDLVTCFDCLHDMGDPVSAARRIRKALKPGGSWMIVEPFAQDEPEKNFTPIGRMSYAASTMTCVPGALAQKGGHALGAQAGERRLREVLNVGGFSSVRRAAETPLNLVLEARP